MYKTDMICINEEKHTGTSLKIDKNYNVFKTNQSY